MKAYLQRKNKQHYSATKTEYTIVFSIDNLPITILQIPQFSTSTAFDAELIFSEGSSSLTPKEPRIHGFKMTNSINHIVENII